MTTSLTGKPRHTDPLAVAWGEELKRYRSADNADLTQVQLAELLGIHQTTVSQIERGALIPSTRLQHTIIEKCELDDATVLRLVRGASA